MLDRILVQRFEAATSTKGGIILPDKAIGKVLQGTVIAVGPGKRDPNTGKLLPCGVSEGDRVLLPEYGGTKVEIGEDNKEYILFRESDILAKVE